MHLKFNSVFVAFAADDSVLREIRRSYVILRKGGLIDGGIEFEEIFDFVCFLNWIWKISFNCVPWRLLFFIEAWKPVERVFYTTLHVRKNLSNGENFPALNVQNPVRRVYFSSVSDAKSGQTGYLLYTSDARNSLIGYFMHSPPPWMTSFQTFFGEEKGKIRRKSWVQLENVFKWTRNCSHFEFFLLL